MVHRLTGFIRSGDEVALLAHGLHFGSLRLVSISDLCQRGAVVSALILLFCVLVLEFGGGLRQGVCGLRFFRRLILCSGLLHIVPAMFCVSYVTDSLEFAVEEPSSCSKRWSTWMVVVLCESPEFLLSVRTLATLITRRLQRIWSFSNVGRTHFGVWSEGFRYDTTEPLFNQLTLTL
ncbi:hypothetical protein YC2023_010253 [Brassica napus]